MRNVSRINDVWTGVCCTCPGTPGMSGIIITGSPDVLTNDLGTARINDIVIGSCGHVGIIVSGNSTVLANDRPVAAIGDLVGGGVSGTIVTGSGDVFEG